MKSQRQGNQTEGSREGQVCPPLPPSLRHTDSVSHTEQQQPENAGLLLRAVERADKVSPTAAAPAAFIALPPLQHRTDTHSVLLSLLAERGESKDPGGCPTSQKFPAQLLQRWVTDYLNLRGGMFSTTPIFLSKGLHLQWDKMGIWGSPKLTTQVCRKTMPW